MDSLDKDAKNILRLLIAIQHEWHPEIDINIGGGQFRSVPLTLIGDEREQAI